MTVMLTILALLVSGLPCGACCAVSVSSAGVGSVSVRVGSVSVGSVSVGSGSVQGSDQVVESCPSCPSCPGCLTPHSSRDQAGNCCESLQHACDCHRHTVAMFIIEDSLGSDAETSNDSTHAQFSCCEQLSRARLGEAYLASLAPQGASATATVLLCRFQL